MRFHSTLLRFFLCTFFGTFLASNARAERTRVGAVVSLTGPDSELGKSYQEGILLALKENDPEGKFFELFVQDTGEHAGLTSNGINHLISKDAVSAVLGCFLSPTLEAARIASEVAEREHIALVLHTATSEKLTSNGRYVWRIVPSLEEQGSSLARFAIEKLKAKSAYIFKDLDSNSSQSISAAFQEVFLAKKGNRIIENAYWSRKIKNYDEFREMARKSNENAADVVLLPNNYMDTGFVARETAKFPMTAKILLSDDSDNKDFYIFAASGAAGHYIYKNSPLEAAQNSQANFTKTFLGHYPLRKNEREAYSSYEQLKMAAFGYDSASLVFQALQRTGADREAVNTALRTTKDFRGVTGIIQRFRSGSAVKAGAIFKTFTENAELEILLDPR